MRLNVTALAITAALIWGGAILVVGFANMVWPPYGQAFLNVVASIYPGYQPGTGFGSVVSGALYGLVDGGIGAAVFGWLYNLIAGRSASPAP
jgi:hypothetical protein